MDDYDKVKTSYGVYAACNAPWNNMYFTATGKVSPCWKLPGYCDDWSPTRSIMDIWNGDKFQSYRDALKNNQFINRCSSCKNDIDNKVWPLARAYEEFGVNDNGYPTLMELELSNQCNLECIMCSGLLSSGIRKNRDKLPPLPQIYNQEFRIQVREFLPHLKEIRFNGGEPLTHKIVLDICEDISEINPTLPITMATNGTVYNKRVKYLMDKCNIHFNVSIDSLIPERYAEIRINGHLEDVLKNFEIYRQYRQSKSNNSPIKGLSVMVNPMRMNWDEMINFGIFAKTNNVNIWYNTILYPEHLAIWNLSSKELIDIYNTLKYKLNQTSNLPHQTLHFVNHQLQSWILDSLER